MDMGQKGELHSNIPGNAGSIIVDTDTNRIIGEANPSPKGIVILGGETWKV